MTTRTKAAESRFSGSDNSARPGFRAQPLVNPEVVGAAGAYVVASMAIGLGGAAFTVFFLAVGKVILKTGAMPAVIGALASWPGSHRRWAS